jgi:hypothetical protein
MRILGTLLAVAGVILIAYGGLALFIPSGDLWLGSLSIHVHENLVIPLPPILGLFFLILGIGMIASAPAAAPPPA